MKNIKRTITINRPAQEVFDFTLSPRNTPKWVDGIVTEHTNETPTKLGTIYRNQGKNGSWSEFEITDYEPGTMFEMTKKASSIHVKYTFKSLNDKQCELEYYVWTDEGDLGERFSQDNIQNILQKLKGVMESA